MARHTYRITFAGGQRAETATSLAAARRVSGARYALAWPDGRHWGMYATRADLDRDRDEGACPYALIERDPADGEG